MPVWALEADRFVVRLPLVRKAVAETDQMKWSRCRLETANGGFIRKIAAYRVKELRENTDVGMQGHAIFEDGFERREMDGVVARPGRILRFALGCGLAGLLGIMLPAQSQELTNVRGAIEAVNPKAGWYAIVPDSDRGTRYAPDRLPDEFKKDGLRVIFSGQVGRVDPSVRSWGIPLTLTKIEIEPKARAVALRQLSPIVPRGTYPIAPAFASSDRR